MTQSDWDLWSDYHCGIFRFDKDADVEMVQLWREGFEQAGCSYAELRAASLWLAMNHADGWRAEQATMLLRRIRQVRRDALEKAERERRAREDEEWRRNAQPWKPLAHLFKLPPVERKLTKPPPR